MKLEVGKTYIVKVTDFNKCELIGEYTKIQALAKKIWPTIVLTSRSLLFIISIIVTPLLVITIPLMKKYPMDYDKPTELTINRV